MSIVPEHPCFTLANFKLFNKRNSEISDQQLVTLSLFTQIMDVFQWDDKKHGF